MHTYSVFKVTNNAATTKRTPTSNASKKLNEVANSALPPKPQSKVTNPLQTKKAPNLYIPKLHNNTAVASQMKKRFTVSKT